MMTEITIKQAFKKARHTIAPFYYMSKYERN